LGLTERRYTIIVRPGCYVAAVDACPLPPDVELDEFWRHDLNDLPLPVDAGTFD
jgi:hypothetical protein